MKFYRLYDKKNKKYIDHDGKNVWLIKPNIKKWKYFFLPFGQVELHEYKTSDFKTIVV